MNAVIHMQPLDERREAICPPMLAGTAPRDGVERRFAVSLDLDRYGNRFPFYLRVWADGRHGGDFEVDCAPPERFRHLNSVTCYQHLMVLPRRMQ